MNLNTTPTLEDLFQQLGLPSTPGAVKDFVRRHAPLPVSVRLSDAAFWRESQREFLKEQWRADGEWAPVIDELNAMLSPRPDPAALPKAASD